MSELYEQIDKEEQRRKKWRWIKQKLQGVGGLVQLALYLAALAAIGYVLWLGYQYFLAESVNKFLEKFRS